MLAANTKDCFRECIGHLVIGVLFDALPRNRSDLSAGNKTLILDDGRGLTISGSGAFWIDSSEDVRRAVEDARRALEATTAELRDVLVLAGTNLPPRGETTK